MAPVSAVSAILNVDNKAEGQEDRCNKSDNVGSISINNKCKYIDDDSSSSNNINNDKSGSSRSIARTRARTWEEATGRRKTFPCALYDMLEKASDDSDTTSSSWSHILSWQSHGKAFRIHKQKDFIQTIMPSFSRSKQSNKWSSFQRQINLYGFQRITTGKDKGSYYHPSFIRGRPGLARHMERCPVKGTKQRMKSDINTQPNFYDDATTDDCSNNPATITPPRPAAATTTTTMAARKINAFIITPQHHHQHQQKQQSNAPPSSFMMKHWNERIYSDDNDSNMILESPGTVYHNQRSKHNQDCSISSYSYSNYNDYCNNNIRCYGSSQYQHQHHHQQFFKREHNMHSNEEDWISMQTPSNNNMLYTSCYPSFHNQHEETPPASFPKLADVIIPSEFYYSNGGNNTSTPHDGDDDDDVFDPDVIFNNKSYE